MASRRTVRRCGAAPPPRAAARAGAACVAAVRSTSPSPAGAGGGGHKEEGEESWPFFLAVPGVRRRRVPPPPRKRGDPAHDQSGLRCLPYTTSLPPQRGNAEKKDGGMDIFGCVSRTSLSFGLALPPHPHRPLFSHITRAPRSPRGTAARACRSPQTQTAGATGRVHAPPPRPRRLRACSGARRSPGTVAPTQVGPHVREQGAHQGARPISNLFAVMQTVPCSGGSAPCRWCPPPRTLRTGAVAHHGAARADSVARQRGAPSGRGRGGRPMTLCSAWKVLQLAKPIDAV